MATAPDSVAALIDECQGLVRSLAVAIHRKLPPNVELDDLIAYGQVGLVEAAREFDPARGNRFSTYAYYRIRGAIYDGLSKMSWFGRNEQSQLRAEERANAVLEAEAEEHSQPGAPEALESDLRWFRRVTRALAVVHLATGTPPGEAGQSESLVDPGAPNAVSVAMREELYRKLHEVIETLPQDAAALIRATYFEGLTLQEAGRRIGISKSWASRLHAKALQRLAHALKVQGISA